MNNHTAMNDAPLYNSRILVNYVEYVEKRYPALDVDAACAYAGVTTCELADGGHWFSQHQVDRLHEFLVRHTENPNIARDAGRRIVSSKRLGAIRQWALGFLDVGTIYGLMDKLYPTLSRGATVRTRRLGPTEVEITATPVPGVVEKPHQCENRLGSLESIASTVLGRRPTVEHTECFHKGAAYCRYLIAWEKSKSLWWARFRNLVFTFGVLVTTPLLFAGLLNVGLLAAGVWLCASLFCAWNAERLWASELAQTLTLQGSAGKALLKEANKRYDNAALIQEIGRSISAIRDPDTLVETVVSSMKKRMDFDRAMVLLTNDRRTGLRFVAGYGLDERVEQILRRDALPVANKAGGPFAFVFRTQSAIFGKAAQDPSNLPTEEERELIRLLQPRSFLCVPIVYKGLSLGVVAVDRAQRGVEVTQSDVNLVQGLASQLAVSVKNSDWFRKLQQSERELRRLSSSILEHQEKERATLSRELHDELGQVLSVLRMEAVWVRKRFDAKQDTVGAQRAVTMSEVIDKAIEDVRTLAFRLRPDVLDKLGLADALELAANDFEARTAISCVFGCEGVVEPRPAAATAAYRIAQEALSNVARHSNAASVEIALRVGEDLLQLAISDDGVGVQPEVMREATGLGLRGMRERASLVGGTLEISPVAPAGTRVCFEAPLDSPEAPGEDR